MNRTVERYLERRTQSAQWPLEGDPSGPSRSIVVIPALGEYPGVMETLADLAACPESLDTLVIVVVNNRHPDAASAEDISLNRQTLEALQKWDSDHLRVTWVDASSPGLELPEKEGVGLARKLGLDAGLQILADLDQLQTPLVCLDGDTRVDDDYLPALHRFFESPDRWAAILSYAHPIEGDPQQQAAIPGGLPKELSGAGCVQLTQMRLVTGMEVEWVEGWVLPPADGWTLPEGAAKHEIDCPAYGRLGLSGGIVCEIPPPRAEADMSCRVWVEGEQGQAWMNAPLPTLIRGKGSESTPVYPDFFAQEYPRPFEAIAAQLLHASETGEEILCSGHDYRQALEIAIAFKRSASRGGQRVPLPLDSRNYRIYPHPYRMRGGDVAGWESIGYTGPPEVA